MIPIVQKSDIPKENKYDIKFSDFFHNINIIRWNFSANINLLYLFDNCQISDSYPFVYCRSEYDREYTKVNNNYIVDKRLIDSITEFNVKNDGITDKKMEQYQKYIITWYYDGEEYHRIFVTENFIEFNQSSQLKNLSSEDIILKIFPDLNNFIENYDIIKSKGVFYVWNIPNFNKNLLLDFFTCNEIGRKFFTIRENLRLKKLKKKNIKVTYTYPSSSLIISNISILIQELKIGQNIFKTKYWNDVGLGNTYMNINFSITKQNVISSSTQNNIIKTFSKLMNLYVEHASLIKDDYINFGLEDDVEFAKVHKNKDKKESKVKLNREVPEMFVSGYATKCQIKQDGFDKKIQVYTSKEDVEKAMKKNKKLKYYMAYPANEDYLEYIGGVINGKNDDDENPLNPIPIDFPTYYFLCDHEKHINPGLMINKTLSNREKFPYLPCCYARVDKKYGIDKNLYNYLHGIHPIKGNVTTTSANMKIKGKIQLKANIKAPVPTNIEDIFKIIKPSYTFTRMGVESSRFNSFIKCLSVALSIDLDIKDTLINSNTTNIGLLKQCNYDMSIDEIVNTFFMSNDDNVYLDPRRLVPFFEEALNINIILFGDVKKYVGIKDDDDEENYETTIIQPRSKNCYLQWEHGRRHTVLIYLSTGSKHLEDERCELITATSPNGSYVSVFNRSMYEYLRYLTVNIYNQFSLFTPYHTFVLPEFFNSDDVKIKYQSIDDFGKVYRIQIGDDYTLDTQPLPPIPNTKIKRLSVKPITNDKQLEKLVADSKFCLKENKIIFNKNNINFVVFLQKDRNILDLNEYIKEKHCANILKDIFVYLFSKYYSKVKDNDDDIIKEFANKFEISNNIEETTEFLFNHPPTFLKLKEYNSHFSYPNEECKKRIVYYLELLLKYNPEYVYNYKDKTYLDHFYSSIYSFKKSPHFFITTSLDSLEYINRQFLISRTILPSEHTEPYFFYDKWTTRTHPVLTRNMMTLKGALKLASFWKTYRYVPQINIETGKFDYPEEFENKFDESSVEYTLLDFDDLEKVEKQSKYVKNIIIAKQSFKESNVFCPLLF